MMKRSLVGVVALLAACSSSSSNSNADGGGGTENDPDAGTHGKSTPDGSASKTDAPSGVKLDGGKHGDTGTSSEGGPPAESGSPADTGPGKNGDAEAGAPGSGPSVGGCAIFPADNPWNTRIDDVTKYPVHPDWASFQTTMNLSTHLHPDWGDWQPDHYGIPWQTVPSTQALVPMTFEYADQSDPGPYPFPPTAKVEGGSGSGGDMHVLVVEQGTCLLYETWQSTLTNPGWSCGSGAKFDLSSNTLRPDGWTSADAAGLPIFPGLVKVSEVQAGAILHAIRFTMNTTQQAYIHPATHAAGVANTSAPPMGLRLRLKASFDTSAFTGATLVVMTALKEYGLILADNGSDWFFGGDSDDAWTPLMDQLVGDFENVHGSDFEAVYTGETSTAGL